MPRIGHPPNTMDDFWQRIEKTDGCWIWRGLAPRGYGVFKLNGRQRRVHRVAYEAARGPIPEGLQLDHLCRNTLCVRPDHLEAVTAEVNVHRSMNPAGVNVRKAQCSRGHALTPENVYGHDGRHCRICALITLRARRDRQRDARIAAGTYTPPAGGRIYRRREIAV